MHRILPLTFHFSCRRRLLTGVLLPRIMEIMKIPRFTETPVVRPSAEPIFLDGGRRGDTRGVLLFHGWTGYPGEMKFLAERLHEGGFTVSVPRLPGHGTCGNDFAESGARDWCRRAVDSYAELKGRCASVYVAGLSMGGLLTLYLSSFFSPERIALAAPAVTNTNTFIKLTPLVSLFVKKTWKRKFQEDTEDEDRKYFAREYWSWNWIAQAAEVRKMQRFIRPILPRVTAPCLTIVSKKDPTVPLKAGEIVHNEISSKTKKKIVLEKSPHVLVNGPERELAAESILRWFLEEIPDSSP